MINNLTDFIDKVFRKMGFKISKPDLDSIVNCVPDAIERVLKVI